MGPDHLFCCLAGQHGLRVLLLFHLVYPWTSRSPLCVALCYGNRDAVGDAVEEDTQQAHLAYHDRAVLRAPNVCWGSVRIGEGSHPGPSVIKNRVDKNGNSTALHCTHHVHTQAQETPQCLFFCCFSSSIVCFSIA